MIGSKDVSKLSDRYVCGSIQGIYQAMSATEINGNAKKS